MKAFLSPSLRWLALPCRVLVLLALTSGLSAQGLDPHTCADLGLAPDQTAIAAGTDFTFVIANTPTQPWGSLWATGANSSGQLGLGSTANQLEFQRVGTGGNWVAVAAGTDHAVGLRIRLNQNGVPVDANNQVVTDPANYYFEVYAWGGNAEGQIGNGTRTDVSVPTLVFRGSFIGVYAGDQFSAALRRDGTLFVWGDNSAGQTGRRPIEVNPLSPIEISGVRFQSVALGSDHVLGVTTDGALYAWGSNFFRQLGLKETVSQVGTRFPTQVGTNTNWAEVYAGSNSSFAITTGGQLFAWGDASFSRLGNNTSGTVNAPKAVLPTPEGGWDQVAVGVGHALAITSAGEIWGWGLNTSGQIALSITNEEDPFNRTYTYSTPQNLSQIGRYSPALSSPLDAVEVAAGNAFSQVRLPRSLPNQYNDIWLTGDNSSGVFGTGDTLNSDFFFLSSFGSVDFQLAEVAIIPEEGNPPTIPGELTVSYKIRNAGSLAWNDGVLVEFFLLPQGSNFNPLRDLPEDIPGVIELYPASDLDDPTIIFPGPVSENLFENIQAQTVTLSVQSSPEGIREAVASGRYQLFAVINQPTAASVPPTGRLDEGQPIRESTTENNYQFAQDTDGNLAVINYEPDLAIGRFGLQQQGAAIVSPGTIGVNVRVDNLGTGPVLADVPVDLTFYLSSNDTLLETERLGVRRRNSGDSFALEYDFTAQVPGAKGNVVAQLELQLTRDLQPGTYNLYVVVDANEQVTETLDTNNVQVLLEDPDETVAAEQQPLSITLKPDLVIQVTLNTSPEGEYVGGEGDRFDYNVTTDAVIEAEVFIQNNGTAPLVLADDGDPATAANERIDFIIEAVQATLGIDDGFALTILGGEDASIPAQPFFVDAADLDALNAGRQGIPSGISFLDPVRVLEVENPNQTGVRLNLRIDLNADSQVFASFQNNVEYVLLAEVDPVIPSSGSTFGTYDESNKDLNDTDQDTAEANNIYSNLGNERQKFVVPPLFATVNPMDALDIGEPALEQVGETLVVREDDDGLPLSRTIIKRDARPDLTENPTDGTVPLRADLRALIAARDTGEGEYVVDYGIPLVNAAFAQVGNPWKFIRNDIVLGSGDPELYEDGPIVPQDGDYAEPPYQSLASGVSAYFEIEVIGPVIIQFDWGLLSEDDTLEFTIDGGAPSNVESNSISGTAPAETFRAVVDNRGLSDGNSKRTLRWTYTRGSSAQPTTFAYVDNIMIRDENRPDLVISEVVTVEKGTRDGVTELNPNAPASEASEFVLLREDSLEITANVFNLGTQLETIQQGTGEGSQLSNTFDVEVRLSADKVWGNRDDVVLGVMEELTKAPGNPTFDYIFSQIFVLNYCFPEGDYYLAIYADSGQKHSEFRDNGLQPIAPDGTALTGVQNNNIYFSEQAFIRIDERPFLVVNNMRYRPGLYFREEELFLQFDLSNIGCLDYPPGFPADINIDLEAELISRTETRDGDIGLEIRTTFTEQAAALRENWLNYTLDAGLGRNQTINVQASVSIPRYWERALYPPYLNIELEPNTIVPRYPQFELSFLDTTFPLGIFPDATTATMADNFHWPLGEASPDGYYDTGFVFNSDLNPAGESLPIRAIPVPGLAPTGLNGTTVFDLNGLFIERNPTSLDFEIDITGAEEVPLVWDTLIVNTAFRDIFVISTPPPSGGGQSFRDWQLFWVLNPQIKLAMQSHPQFGVQGSDTPIYELFPLLDTRAGFDIAPTLSDDIHERSLEAIGLPFRSFDDMDTRMRDDDGDGYSNLLEWALVLNPYVDDTVRRTRSGAEPILTSPTELLEDFEVTTTLAQIPVGVGRVPSLHTVLVNGSGQVVEPELVDESAQLFLALTFNSLSAYTNEDLIYQVWASDSPFFDGFPEADERLALDDPANANQTVMLLEFDGTVSHRFLLEEFNTQATLDYYNLDRSGPEEPLKFENLPSANRGNPNLPIILGLIENSYSYRITVKDLVEVGELVVDSDDNPQRPLIPVYSNIGRYMTIRVIEREGSGDMRDSDFNVFE